MRSNFRGTGPTKEFVDVCNKVFAGLSNIEFFMPPDYRGEMPTAYLDSGRLVIDLSHMPVPQDSGDEGLIGEPWSDRLQGDGEVGHVALFIGDGVLGGAALTAVLEAEFGELLENPGVLGYTTQEGYGWKMIGTMLQTITGYGNNKILATDSQGAEEWIDAPPDLPSEPAAGDVLYYNGEEWVALGKPATEQFLSNDEAGVPSWADPPSGGVTEKTENPFQENKLVLGSSTAKELWGTSVGINPHGSDHGGYDNLGIPTDARAAAIADARIVAGGVVAGLGTVTQIAVFDDDRLLSSNSLGNLFANAFGIPTGGFKIFATDVLNERGWYTITSVLVGVAGYGNSKMLATDGAGNIGWENKAIPSGSAGQILVNNGTAWVALSIPASGTAFLRNTSGGAVSWGHVDSTGGTGAALVDSNGRIKTITGDI